MNHDLVSGRDFRGDGNPLHVHADYNGLRAERVRALRNDFRMLHGGGVHGNLFRAREQLGPHVLYRGNAAPPGEGDENIRGDLFHHVEEDPARLGGSRDVVKDDFVGPGLVILPGGFHRIADVFVAHELDALGQAPVAHVKARDNPFRQHTRPPALRAMHHS